MIGRRVDIRYARAVYENAKEEQVQGAVYQDMVELIYLYINVMKYSNKSDQYHKKARILKSSPFCILAGKWGRNK